MTAVLLDVNVLLALAWPNHQHHRAATAWFLERNGKPWATCPTTQCGFVRLSSNLAFTRHARPPREAVNLLVSLTSQEGHRFFGESFAITDAEFVLRSAGLTGHRQVMDLYLLVVAHKAGLALATFDGAMRALACGEPVVEVIPDPLG